MTLDELPDIPPRTVELRGRTFHLVNLSVADRLSIVGALKTIRGAPVAVSAELAGAALAAVALGVKHQAEPGGELVAFAQVPPHRRVEWLRAAVSAVREKLTPYELRLVLEVLERPELPAVTTDRRRRDDAGSWLFGSPAMS